MNRESDRNKHDELWRWVFGVFSLALATVVCSSARAEIVVEFNGTNRYLNADNWPMLMEAGTVVDTAGSSRYGALGSTRTWCYDFDAPVSPAYSAKGGPQYFAAFEQQLSFGAYADHPVEALNVYRIGTPPASDQVRFWGRQVVTDQDPYVAITLFLFFKPAPYETVIFSPDDTIRVNAAITGTLASRRLAVCNAGTWYVAQNNFTLNVAVTNLHEVMWAAWDPSGAPLAALPSAAVYTTLGSDLDAITALGFVYTSYRNSKGAAPRLALTEYTADVTVHREMLTMTSRWTSVQYEAKDFPENVTPPWAVPYSAGTRKIEGEKLTADTTGTDGYHFYSINNISPVLDPAGDGYLLSWRMALPANETTIRFRERADASFMISVSEWDASIQTNRRYYVGIDNERLATAYRATGGVDGIPATQVLFSEIQGFSAKNQHVYTLWRTQTGLKIYIDGILRSEDTGFSPDEELSSDAILFGDQASSFDHKFELDYIRAGIATLPPPTASIVIVR